MKRLIPVFRHSPSVSKFFRNELASFPADSAARGFTWRSLRPFVFSCCVASVSLSCSKGQVAELDPGTPPRDPQLEKYEAYFKGLNLPYMEPLGCDQARTCRIAEDFNDDGTVDLAGLYEYSGPTSRVGNNYVDLVILYSSEDSDRPRHQIFRYVGAIDKDNRVRANLEKQERGEMMHPLGIVIRLNRPAINVLQDGQEPGTYFPTYYWNGKRFASIDKSTD